MEHFASLFPHLRLRNESVLSSESRIAIKGNYDSVYDKYVITVWNSINSTRY